MLNNRPPRSTLPVTIQMLLKYCNCTVSTKFPGSSFQVLSILCVRNYHSALFQTLPTYLVSVHLVLDSPNYWIIHQNRQMKQYHLRPNCKKYIAHSGLQATVQLHKIKLYVYSPVPSVTSVANWWCASWQCVDEHTARTMTVNLIHIAPDFLSFCKVPWQYPCIPGNKDPV